MLVKELIAELHKFPEDMLVLCSTESGLEEVGVYVNYDVRRVFKDSSGYRYADFLYSQEQVKSVVNALVIE